MRGHRSRTIVRDQEEVSTNVFATQRQTPLELPRHRVAADAPLFAQLEDRLVAAGITLAIAAVVVQTVAHLLNATFLGTYHLNVNHELTPFAWASTVATFGLAFTAAVHALVCPSRRALSVALALAAGFLSLDDMVSLHERLGLALAEALGLSVVFDSVIWPALFLPLVGATALLALALASGGSPRARRLAQAGLALLALALVAEVGSAAWSTNPFGRVHSVEGGFEEAAELAGWILLMTMGTVVALQQTVLGATRLRPVSSGATEYREAGMRTGLRAALPADAADLSA